MEFRLILLVILAHIFGDFILQGNFITSMRFPNKLINKTSDLIPIKLTSKMNIISATKAIQKKDPLHTSENKPKLNNSNTDLKTAIEQAFYFPLKVAYIIRHTVKGNIIHSLIQGFTLLSFIYLNNLLSGIIAPNKYFSNLNIEINCINSLYVIGYFMLMHYIIDQLKVVFTFRHPRLSKNIYFFILDQILHLLSFLLIPAIYLEQISLSSKVIRRFFYSPNNFILNEKLLVILIIFFTTTAFAGIFIKTVIEHIDEKHIKNNEEPCGMDMPIQSQKTEIRRGGYTIGILERILIISSILISHP
ncbi:MAG: DUF3307 domain-containing protein, partial [Clostridiaceae bacterium]|nr:DUF3307 domain-containing protein [Clostridiaceae bacterium]